LTLKNHLKKKRKSLAKENILRILQTKLKEEERGKL
jgi:hypothetical protein